MRFEGPISWRSGVVYGKVVAFRLLADGEHLPMWPPPREFYGADALPVGWPAPTVPAMSVALLESG